jgi:hypothetical protein
MTDIDDLRDLLGAPAYSGPPFNWEAASAAIGANIPADFRSLVNAFGPGDIGTDVVLLAPGHPDSDYDQIGVHRERRAGLAEIWETELDGPPEFISKPAVFNEPGVEPVLWGYSTLGYYMYWVAKPGQDPASWQLALDVARDGSWEFHSGPVTSFLLGLLRGQITSRHLYFLSETEQHTFTPAPE